MRPDERLPTKRAASSGSRVPPAVTSTRLPARLPGVRAAARRARDLGRLGHPAHAPLALGRLALVGPDELDAAREQRLGVRAGRRVRPHARVHRRRDEHRAAVGERRLGEEVVGEAVRELRERVRGARRDDEQVGARQVEVEVLRRRAPRERREGLGADEALGARRDERDHLVPVLHEQARELARLVGGDPAGDAEEDPAHLLIVHSPPCEIGGTGETAARPARVRRPCRTGRLCTRIHDSGSDSHTRARRIALEGGGCVPTLGGGARKRARAS